MEGKEYPQELHCIYNKCTERGTERCRNCLHNKIARSYYEDAETISGPRITIQIASDEAEKLIKKLNDLIKEK